MVAFATKIPRISSPDTCYQSCLVHDSETWALKKAYMELLSVAQCKVERIMLGITLRDHTCNTWIVNQTGVNDTIDVIKNGMHG